jgi:hypothetical protein
MPGPGSRAAARAAGFRTGDWQVFCADVALALDRACPLEDP